MHTQKSGVHKLTFILLIIGGLNWLLLGLFGWEIGELFGGPGAFVSRLVYILVGLSALVELTTHKKMCCACGRHNDGQVVNTPPAAMPEQKQEPKNTAEPMS